MIQNLTQILHQTSSVIMYHKQLYNVQQLHKVKEILFLHKM